VSGNTQLSRRLWEYFHSWRLEWALPASDATRGYLRWYMNDMLVYGITGKSLADKVKGSMVSLAWPRVAPRVAPRVSCCSWVCARAKPAAMLTAAIALAPRGRSRASRSMLY